MYLKQEKEIPNHNSITNSCDINDYTFKLDDEWLNSEQNLNSKTYYPIKHKKGYMLK